MLTPECSKQDPSKVSPKMARIPKPNGLMVVEAKKADLPKHVPQLVLEMYSSAKEQECVKVSRV